MDSIALFCSLEDRCFKGKEPRVLGIQLRNHGNVGHARSGKDIRLGDAKFGNKCAELIGGLDKVHGEVIALHCVSGVSETPEALIARDANGKIRENVLNFRGPGAPHQAAEEQNDDDVPERSHATNTVMRSGGSMSSEMELNGRPTVASSTLVGTFGSHAGNLNSTKRDIATPTILARSIVCALNVPRTGLRTRGFL
jgi:hypothetical protein